MPAFAPAIAMDRFTTFGDLLKYLRRRTGLTQIELSIAVGYSDTQVSRLELNQRLPDLATIAARFVPALGLEHEPEITARFMELAAGVRREDAPAPGLSPFKGLQFFDEVDAHLFFGREALVTRLVSRLLGKEAPEKEGMRFLAVVGASGSGKSSIVRAGLIPALRWNRASADWPIHVLTPTAHPLETLAINLTRETESPAATAALMDDFARDPRSLHLHVRRLLSPLCQSGRPSEGNKRSESRLVLVVDQMEELFTLCRDEVERQAFVDNLLTAVELDGPTILILTLRADFYAHCAPYPNLRQTLTKNQEYIGPMNSDGLRHAIEEPAKRGGWEFEAGLVDLILKDVGNEPGALPLLSHALLETWHRRQGHRLTLGGYLSSGGVRGAIAETAEAVFKDQLSPEQRKIARHIFLRLTELGDDTTIADTRRRVPFDELISKPDEASAVYEVLNRLADARLIVTETNAAEVAHEALIREWPTLRVWLEEDRDSLRLYRRLTYAANAWAEAGRQPGDLYREARLAQALEWQAAPEVDLNHLEREFLQASKEHADHEALERKAQNQRELERELATESLNNLDVDPELSILLAIEAVSQTLAISQTAMPEAEEVLHQAVAASRALLTIPVSKETIMVAFSKDSTRLAIGNSETAQIWDLATLQEVFVTPVDSDLYAAFTIFKFANIFTTTDVVSVISEDGTRSTVPVGNVVEVYDTATNKQLFALSGHAASITDAAFSPDGTRIATSSEDYTTKIWDVETGHDLQTLSGHTNIVSAVGFSPDGKFLATTSWDRKAILWDVATGQQLFKLGGHAGFVLDLAFSPDGRYLVTASNDDTIRLWNISPDGAGELPTLSFGQNRGMRFSLDQTLIAVRRPDSTVEIRDLAHSKLLSTLSDPDGHLGLTFSADGKRLATGSPSKGRISIWDSATGKQLLKIADDGAFYFSNFSLDGTRMATGYVDGTIKVRDATTGKVDMILARHNAAVWTAAFSPDGSRIVSVAFDGTIKVWNAETGQELISLLHSDKGIPKGLAFSSDGKRFVTGSQDGTAKVWNLETGEELLTLLGHTNTVYSLAYSPDGTKIATAASDATAKVWDASTGRLLFTLYGATLEHWDIAFSPNGRRLLTASADGNVRTYLVNLEDELDLARSRLTRGWRQEECQQYLHVAVRP